MKSFLCDSNVFIDYLRGFRDTLQLLRNPSQIKVSVVTYGELIQGASNKKGLSNLKQFINNFEMINIDESISKKAVDILETYYLSSGILLFDALIAATAIENDLTLLTGNLKHFKSIKGLKIVKW